MNVRSFYERYLDEERRVVLAHNAHPLFANFSRLGREKIIQVLLQLGHLSAQFVSWYEFAKQMMEDERAKEVVRMILRDEIPRTGPTHQDDRLHDLILLGVPKMKAIHTGPCAGTNLAKSMLHMLVANPEIYVPDTQDERGYIHLCDVHILVVLRTAGEVLVGETYRFVTEAWTSVFGLDRAASRFYVPHFEHDREHKEKGGHLAPFDTLLREWIVDDATLMCAIAAAREAARARTHVYDAFNPLHWW